MNAKLNSESGTWSADLARALAVLESGGLIGLPTETVYGLAADASNRQAVAKIFAAKGRPADHPVIVHLAQGADMRDWAVDIPASAWKFAKQFWPGPLTLILKRAGHVLDGVTGGQDTVGLRVPSHPMAHAVLKQFARSRPGRPAGLAAPSANQFGRISPTTAQHVRDEFGDAVEWVLDGGACEVGIESTIIDCSAGMPRILRPGSISVDAMKSALGAAVRASMPVEPLAPKVLGSAQNESSGMPRVSGSLDAHYAPRTPMRVARGPEFAAALTNLGGKRVAVLSFSTTRVPNTRHWLASAQPAIYAHNLYAHLRAMDIAGCEMILVEAPPQGPEWDGVNDRLGRAAFGSPD